jgi:cobalt transporter subunit CbtB
MNLFLYLPSHRWVGRETAMRLSLTAAKTKTIQAAKIETLKAASLACLLGALLIYGIGFSHIEAVHDAAHDSRHALSFPCH